MHDFVNKKIPQSFESVYSLNCDIRGNQLTRQSDLINIAIDATPHSLIGYLFIILLVYGIRVFVPFLVVIQGLILKVK